MITPGRQDNLDGQKRGCGNLRVNVNYLICNSSSLHICDSLQVEFPEFCPTCGSVVAPHSNLSSIKSDLLWRKENQQNNRMKCSKEDCPTNQSQRIMLGWVHSRYYSPKEFLVEMKERGYSKAVSHLPRDFDPKSSWIAFAHSKAIAAEKDPYEYEKRRPAVLCLCRGSSCVRPVLEDEVTFKVVNHYKSKNIKLIPLKREAYEQSQSKWIYMTANGDVVVNFLGSNTQKYNRIYLNEEKK